MPGGDSPRSDRCSRDWARIHPRRWSRRKRSLALFVLLTLLVAARPALPVLFGRVDDGAAPLLRRIDEEWTIVRQPDKGVVVAMIAVTPTQPPFSGGRNSSIGGGRAKARMDAFLRPSIRDKMRYAEERGYSMVLCTESLDDARHIHWSKIKLIWLLLQKYDVVFWADIDTAILDRSVEVEALVRGKGEDDDVFGEGPDLVAQLDIHRDDLSLYPNAGVMIFRASQWSRNLLARAYRQWQVVFFRGWAYFENDQDALALALGSYDVGLLGNMRRQGWWPWGLNTRKTEDDTHFSLVKYGQLWALPAHVKVHTFVAHLPWCRTPPCIAELLNLYEEGNSLHNAKF